MSKKKEAEKVYKDGFDSKNRIVVLMETDDIFYVSKISTGFYEEFLNKEEAEKEFTNQINCSHN